MGGLRLGLVMPIGDKLLRAGAGFAPYLLHSADYMKSPGTGTRQVTFGDFSLGGAEWSKEGEAGTMSGREFLAPRAARAPRKGDDAGNNGSGTAVITKTKTQTKKPSMYRVLLLNDDYTPMEFVITVLRKYFNKGPDEANRIMLHVHHHGVGECGVFTYEVAETKVTHVMDFARKHQHPLQCIMEKK
ncbi:MAG: ATP-dependent Clp protease adapter protein ClpS [Pseudomonadota bacterium]|jgi:ATP-dependent Clp protease adaptor protein ClpS